MRASYEMEKQIAKRRAGDGVWVHSVPSLPKTMRNGRHHQGARPKRVLITAQKRKATDAPQLQVLSPFFAAFRQMPELMGFLRRW